VESDWEVVLAYQQDPLYLRYYEWTSRTEEEVRAFLKMFLNHQQQVPRIKFQFAVTLKSTGQLIGSCGVRRDSPMAREGDMGYEFDPKHWGNGYATEAARAVLDFGFSHMDLQRVSAWCIAENLASARVLEKIGMKLEKRMRNHQYFKGRWWDALSYSMTYEEWQAKK
jgi:ribosomal-protein-alanine N-acetyltransferase